MCRPKPRQMLTGKEMKDFEAYYKNQLRPCTINFYLGLTNKLLDVLDHNNKKDLLFKPSELCSWLKSNKDFPVSVKYMTIEAVKKYYLFNGKKETWFRGLELPEWNSNERKVDLNEQQIQKLLKDCNDDFEYLAIWLLAYTGMRRSTVLQLEPEDVDYENNSIKIKKDYQGNKSKKEWLVDITPEIADRLKAYIESKNLKKNEKIFVFKDADGNVISNQEDLLTRLVRNLGKKTNINITPHSLRHFFGTFYYDSTRDFIGTQKRLMLKTSAIVPRYTESITDRKESFKLFMKRVGGVI